MTVVPWSSAVRVALSTASERNGLILVYRANTIISRKGRYIIPASMARETHGISANLAIMASWIFFDSSTMVLRV
jgi:hypothetical protein